MRKVLRLAVPKGRLLDDVLEYLGNKGIDIEFASRRLSAVDSKGHIEVIKVKNSDLPTYVHHGITGLGIAGDDVVAESRKAFTRLHTFPFGATRLCIAAPVGTPPPNHFGGMVRVATSYVRMTREWFHRRGIPVKIIRLGGSVELACALGLADYIIDLVETGHTLTANGLESLVTMEEIRVRLIANPAYFKLNYDEIQQLTDILTGGSDDKHETDN